MAALISLSCCGDASSESSLKSWLARFCGAFVVGEALLVEQAPGLEQSAFATVHAFANGAAINLSCADSWDRDADADADANSVSVAVIVVFFMLESA